MEEEENVLRILEGTKIAFEKEDVVSLKNLSNQLINTASEKQNSTIIILAVIVYSLSKIISRTDYKSYPDWDTLHKTIVSSINNSIIAVKKKDDVKLKRSLELIQNSVRKFSGNFKKYIEDVFRMASINKASRIYEHGISMGKTAKLLGITMYELADYAGKTGIPNMPEGKTIDVKSRIKLTEGMFE